MFVRYPPAKIRYEQSGQRLVGFRTHRGPAQQRPGPPRRMELAPLLILSRLVDRVVLTGKMLDGEAHRDRLLSLRIRLLGGMGFARPERDSAPTTCSTPANSKSSP